MTYFVLMIARAFAIAFVAAQIVPGHTPSDWVRYLMVVLFLSLLMPVKRPDWLSRTATHPQ